MYLYYASRVKMNKDFTIQDLVQQVNQWLESRTPMKNPGLIPEQINFPYQRKNDHTSLELKNYEDKKILTIHYVFENDHNNSFIVDLIYQYGKNTHYLSMYFYKALKENSEFEQAVSIPRIFKNILKSPHVLLDHGVNYREFLIVPSKKNSEKLLDASFDLPLVCIHKKDGFEENKHGMLKSEVYLLKENLIGNGHLVLCDRISLGSIEVIYPNGNHKTYSFNDYGIKRVTKDVQEYCCSVFHYKQYSVEGLEMEATRQSNKQVIHQIKTSYTKQELKNNLDLLNKYMIELEEDNRKKAYQIASTKNAVFLIEGNDERIRSMIIHQLQDVLNHTKTNSRIHDILTALLEKEGQE